MATTALQEERHQSHGSPTNASTMVSSTQPSPKEAAQILQDSLVQYFETVCPTEHETHIPIKCASTADAEEPGCTVEFDLPCSLTAEAQFTVERVGGNVWHVSGGLEDRPSKSFTYCTLPEFSRGEKATIGTTIGEFLLTEVQQVVGEQVLQNADTLAAERSA